jgi:hypothetical protein
MIEKASCRSIVSIATTLLAAKGCGWHRFVQDNITRLRRLSLICFANRPSTVEYPSVRNRGTRGASADKVPTYDLKIAAENVPLAR